MVRLDGPGGAGEEYPWRLRDDQLPQPVAAADDVSWPAYVAYSAVSYTGWAGMSALSCAWMRLVAQPAPPGAGASSLMLGSSVTRIRVAMWRGINPFNSQPKMSMLERWSNHILGSIGTCAFTFPLSIMHALLCLRPHAWPIEGLVPWSPLGRQHWAALPAKVVERMMVTASMELSEEWFYERLGLDISSAYEPLRSKYDDIEEDEEDEYESTLCAQIAKGAKQWLVSHAPVFTSTVVSMPWTVMFARMMAEPGRYGSVVACARHIWTTEGAGGFFRELPLALSQALGVAFTA